MSKVVMVKTVKEVINERRFMTLKFSPRIFIQMLSTKGSMNFISNPPVPRDSAVLSVGYDEPSDCLLIRICSETFDPVPEGGVIPRLEAQVETTPCTCEDAKEARLAMKSKL